MLALVVTTSWTPARSYVCCSAGVRCSNWSTSLVCVHGKPPETQPPSAGSACWGMPMLTSVVFSVGFLEGRVNTQNISVGHVSGVLAVASAPDPNHVASYSLHCELSICPASFPSLMQTPDRFLLCCRGRRSPAAGAPALAAAAGGLLLRHRAVRRGMDGPRPLRRRRRNRQARCCFVLSCC